MRVWLVLLMIGSFDFAMGQNYDSDSDSDSDSVYYTPLQKPMMKQKIQKGTSRRSHFPVSYFFTLQSGALVGCKDCAGGKMTTLSSSLVQGVTLGRKGRAGIGLGYDTYRGWEMMPLFSTVSWDLTGDKNRNAVVAQFSYGWSKPFPVQSQEFYRNPTVEGGRMVNAQIGYRIKNGDLKLALWVGYKYQRVFTTYTYPTYYYRFNGTPVLGEPNTNGIGESLSRLQLTMSIGWR